VTVRIRSASRDDQDFLAWVMLSVSRAHLARGLWDLIIGSDERGCQEYLRRLATAEPCPLYHYENFIVLEVGHQAAAALCGFEVRDDRWATAAAAMSSVQRELGWTEDELAASQQRVGPVWACFLQDSGADWGIENVAVRSEFRGRGLVGALLEKTLSDATKRGCRLAQITTYIGHNSARSAYEKVGFRFSDERRCPELASVLGAAGFMRFLREL
jgi:ribosomal protein S18 acetylase RimI-like enzyme